MKDERIKRNRRYLYNKKAMRDCAIISCLIKRTLNLTRLTSIIK